MVPTRLAKAASILLFSAAMLLPSKTLAQAIPLAEPPRPDSVSLIRRAGPAKADNPSRIQKTGMPDRSPYFIPRRPADLSKFSLQSKNRELLPAPLYSASYNLSIAQGDTFQAYQVGLMVTPENIQLSPLDSVTLLFLNRSDSSLVARQTIGLHQGMRVNCPTGPWPVLEARLYGTSEYDSTRTARLALWLDDSYEIFQRGVMRLREEWRVHEYAFRFDSAYSGYNGHFICNFSFHNSDTAVWVIHNNWPGFGAQGSVPGNGTSQVVLGFLLYDSRIQPSSSDTTADVAVFYFTLPRTPVREGGVPPASAALSVYPNPSRGNGPILFVCSLPQPALAQLRVYDAMGRNVADLLDIHLPAGKNAADRLSAGEHAIAWMPPASLPSGVYRAVMTYGGQQESIPVILLR